MAPLTRQRADEDGTPNDLNLKYYTQRSSFGMIITECSPIDWVGNGFYKCTGIHQQSHIDGWKKITDSVHSQGGKIIMQIWHGGRTTTRKVSNGNQPVGPSKLIVRQKRPANPFEEPKELSKEDIQNIIQQFRQGAQNALQAGFDGIQLHGANGYLIDQFLKENSNTRNDEYGGSIENRCRFLLEVIDEIAKVIPSEDISVRLSPTGRFQDQYEQDPLSSMKYLLPQLERRNLGFVELKRHFFSPRREVRATIVEKQKTIDDKEMIDPETQIPDFFKNLRQYYKGTLMGNDGIDLEEAQQLLSDGTLDLVSFGVLAINNPDLTYRIENNLELNTDYTPEYFYTHDAKGYTDIPFYKEYIENKKSN